MATSMKSALRSLGSISNLLQPEFFSRSSIVPQCRNKASWTKFFKKSGEERPSKEQMPAPARKVEAIPVSKLESLKKKEGLVSVRGYVPPPDVNDRVMATARSILGESASLQSPITDRLVKFQLVTRLMSECDHIISNSDLTDLETVEDLVTYMSIPVRDRSSYEDLTHLDLPPNLHIQLDPVRFDANSDQFFDGRNAFPGRPTVVSSLKYRRKYQGNEGESRNQRNLTQFEESIMYSRKT